jgi:ketosteroid isomerase-like protein
MSDNADHLRIFLEDWSREPWTVGHWERADPIDMDFLDPEVIYEDDNLPDHAGEKYQGHDGIRRAARRWLEGSEWLQIDLDRIVGTGDRLVSIHRVRNHSPASGIEFEAPLAYVWTFRDGKVVHFQSYRDPDEALSVAGLD